VENLGVLIALIAMAAFIVSIVAIIKPLPKLFLPTRKIGCLALVGSLVLFGIGGSILPTPKKEGADINQPTTPAKIVATKSPSLKDGTKPDKSAKADVMALWHKVKSASAACDKANMAALGAIEQISKGRGSVYTAYEIADRGHDVCRGSWSELDDLEVPDSVTGKPEDDLEKALGNCANAYLLRQMSLDKMRTVLNGDYRPSALQDFKGDASAAQQGVLVCVAGMMGAALETGVDLKEFK
jgi:hypothetical protein